MSERIDMSPHARETVQELLQRHLPEVTVWAYGSRVKGTSRPESDFDLVVFAAKEQRGDVADLREAFDQSNLPFRVDVCIWEKVPERFQEEIRERYEVVQRGRPRLKRPYHGDSHSLTAQTEDKTGFEVKRNLSG